MQFNKNKKAQAYHDVFIFIQRKNNINKCNKNEDVIDIPPPPGDTTKTSTARDKTMPKMIKNNPRIEMVSLVRHAALELSNLANTIEQLGELDKAATSLRKFPNIIDIMRKATWELQNGNLDKVSDLISQINDEIANEIMAQESVG